MTVPLLRAGPKNLSFVLPHQLTPFFNLRSQYQFVFPSLTLIPKFNSFFRPSASVPLITSLIFSTLYLFFGLCLLRHCICWLHNIVVIISSFSAGPGLMNQKTCVSVVHGAIFAIQPLSKQVLRRLLSNREVCRRVDLDIFENMLISHADEQRTPVHLAVFLEQWNTPKVCLVLYSAARVEDEGQVLDALNTRTPYGSIQSCCI